MAEIYNHVNDVYMIATNPDSVDAIRKIMREIGQLMCIDAIDITNEQNYDASIMPNKVPYADIPKSHTNTLWKIWRALEEILIFFTSDNNSRVHQYANSENHNDALTYLRWKSFTDAFRKSIGRGTKCNQELRKTGVYLSKQIHYMKCQLDKYLETHNDYPLFAFRITKLERFLHLIDLSMWMRRHLFDDQIETSTDSFLGNKFIDFRNGVLTIKATY